MAKRARPAVPLPWPRVQAFLQDIKDHPEDDTRRLIFADWLEEHGDPRGELIRVQCELARLGEDDPRTDDLCRREQALLKRHEAAWLGPLRDPAQAWGFRRGLLHLTVREVQLFR